MCMKNHVIRTGNGNSNLKKISKITKTKCSLKKKVFTQNRTAIYLFSSPTSGGYSNSGPETDLFSRKKSFDFKN